MKNPYERMIETMRVQGAKFNPPSVMLAEVIQGYPDLILRVGDIEITKDNLMVNELLLPIPKKFNEFSGENGGKLKFSGDSKGMSYIGGQTAPEELMPTHAHTAIVNGSDLLTVTIAETQQDLTHGHGVASLSADVFYSQSGEFMLVDYFQVGDIFAVLPTENRQTFIVLCKVFSLKGSE